MHLPGRGQVLGDVDVLSLAGQLELQYGCKGDTWCRRSGVMLETRAARPGVREERSTTSGPPYPEERPTL